MSALLALAALPPAEEVESTAEASWHLWGDAYLADPWFLALLPLALVLLFLGRAGRGLEAGRVPALPVGTLPRTLRQRLGFVPPLLSALALVAVIVALARPLRGNVLTTTVSEGVDIALVLDCSSSMAHKDMEAGRSRLEVVKEVVGDFAARRMTDRVGAADNVALLTFARYPRLLCPFTLDVSALTGFLRGVEIVRYQDEDGTGIGRALAKGVALLRETDARSKVCVLLTDGENNVHDIEPETAARLASEEGIRVYTVLAGEYQYVNMLGQVYPTGRKLDTRQLEEIAEVTGGQFFPAGDRRALEEAYADIEELVRTPRSERRFTETFDLYPPLLSLGLALYLLAWASRSTWARRLPG